MKNIEDNKNESEHFRTTVEITTGSCFWKHRWSKWMQYEQQMFTATGFNYVEHMQRRVCLKCGKVREEIIYNF